MKKISMVFIIMVMGVILFSSGCSHTQKDNSETSNDTTMVQAAPPAYGGFESQVAWGKHLVAIGGCHDCHTPKKMGPHGPEDNLDIALSGSPSQLPLPVIDRKDIESKGLMVMGNSLSFVGPWGVSYAANLTSDTTTGIGNWTIEQFKNVFKTGKYGGAPGGRDLLPPMPWQNVAQMTDDELEAVFAYLQSTKPVHNIVPQPQLPVLAMTK
jgi:mono/diheme cytochrome c family protein